MDIATIAGVVSAVAAVVVIPPAYLVLRKKSGSAAPGPALPPGRPAGGPYDAFISYAPQDSARATELAQQLAARGRKVFHAEVIDYGLIKLLEKQKALLGSANGILVFSEATMASNAVQADYAALLNQVNDNGGRFVPVLIEHVTLPPFAAIRKLVDLTDPASPGYRERVDRLAEAIRPNTVTGGAVC
jgi:hypothetical protein